VVAACVAPALARAQIGTPQFGTAASVTFPVGDFASDVNGDGFKPGWQGMVFLGFRMGGSPLGFRVAGMYGINAANDQLRVDLTSRAARPTDAQTKFVGGDADLTFALPAPTRLKPYVLGGVGLYKVTVSVTSGGVTADTSATRFAWNLGGGFTVGLGGAALFFEARYVHVDAVSGFPQTPFIPITAGIRLGGR
jgi:opacity protein-like surface antigen